jgi:hypothetical protein
MIFGTIECPICVGYGKVWFLLGGLFPWRSPCPTCGGSGQVPAGFVYPSGPPRRSWLQALFGSSSSLTRTRTVQTTVIEEHRTRTTEIVPLAAASGNDPSVGDDPDLPLLVDPFAADADPQEAPEPSAPGPQEDAPSGSDSDQATAY